MHIKVIRKIEDFDALAVEWNELLRFSARQVPFLRHEFLSAWWRTLGGGEWERGDLLILAGYGKDGALRGAAPLFLTQNREGAAALMLLGSLEIADYLDILARPADLPAFVSAMLDFLHGPQAPDWQVLDLYNILEDSPSLPALQAEAERRGLDFTQEKLQHCPYIPLPGDWETYLAGIDKKQRHEIRRKIRRAESQEQPVRWYIVEDSRSLESEIEAFLDLMAQDADKRAFLTEVMRQQMRLAMKAAFDAGWLQLAFLEVGGVKAAGYLNFDYASHIWVYNSGIDYDFSSLSPGWVLMGYLLQWANENKREAFDFMRGDEDYKYRFGGVDRFVVRVRVKR
ncbi:MAG TPA: GNAT family N-acetyltransferase [Anaerolineales bacterium]|nr:GNAT family N-acetyltransferase [Anaerolineales bacterium]